MLVRKCISCGAELKSSLARKNSVCSSCGGNTDMSILSDEYAYGHKSFSSLNTKKPINLRKLF